VIQAFDETILLEPHYFEAWNGKADALNRAKRDQDALAACDQALAINPGYVQGVIYRRYIPVLPHHLSYLGIAFLTKEWNGACVI
jgi:hypothetical protein